MALPAVLISALPAIMDVITKAVPDKDMQQKIKGELGQELLKSQDELAKLASGNVMAEIQGHSWMQRNWRPSLMFVFMLILVNNFVLVPYAVAFGLTVPMLEFPQAFWGLLTVGVGGYIGGRTVEKIKSPEGTSKALKDGLW